MHLIRFPAMSIKEIADFVGLFFVSFHFVLSHFILLKMKCLGPTGILNWEEQRDLLYVIGGASPLGPLISFEAIPRTRTFATYLNTNLH